MNALTLDMDRTLIFLRNDTRSNLKSLLTGIAAAAGLLIIIDIVSLAFGTVPSGRDATFGSILAIGGVIVTSLAFLDLHDGKRATHYLTLPGSTLEKYLSRLLLTTIGWTVLVMAFYMATTLVSAGLSMVIFRDAGEIFLPVTRLTWDSVGNYLAVQSVFFFGAVYFKKNHLLKTILASVIVAFSFAVGSVIAARIAFLGQFEGLIPTEAELTRIFQSVPEAANLRFARVMETIVQVVYRSVMPLFFWILGYRRMRETEV